MISIIRSINSYIVWDLPKTFNFCDKLIRQMYLKLEVANIEIRIVHRCHAYHAVASSRLEKSNGMHCVRIK